MNWLQNPQADYVLAAYGVAAVGLIGLFLLSWCAARRKQREWRQVLERRAKGQP